MTSPLHGGTAAAVPAGNPLRTQLRYKIAAGAATLVIGFGLILGGIGYLEVRDLIRDNKQRAIETQAMLAARHASGRINSIAATMQALAANPVISSGLIDVLGQSPHLAPFLESFTNVRGADVTIALVDLLGRVVERVGPSSAAPPASERVAAALGRAADTAWTDARGDRTAVRVVLPLYYERTQAVEGAVAYSFVLDDVLTAGDSDSVHAFLPDRFTVGLHRHEEHEEHEHGAHGHRPGDEHLHEYVPLALRAPLDSLDLELEITAPSALIAEPLRELSRLVLVAGGICAAIAMFLAYAVASHISRPIRELDEAIADFTWSGRFDVCVRTQGRDETARLGESFNRMMDRLRRDNEQRKQAERAVRDSEQRFRDVAECASDWLWETDAEGRFTYFSGRVEEALGCGPSELIGLRRRDLLADDDAVGDLARIEEAVARGQAFRNLEYKARSKDGSSRTIVVSGMPVFGDDGVLIGYRGAGSDITRIRAAQNALRASEERLRSIFDGAMDGIFVHDAQGRILKVNQAACEALQYTEAELCALSVSDIEVSVDEEALRRLWNSPETSSPRLEGRHRRKDGSEFPVEIRLGCLEAGNDRRFVALVRDVSEREAALAALRRNEERFRTLIDRSASGILVHRAGRPIYVNDAAVGMFGYESVDEVLALKSLFLLFHPDERARLQDYARARLQGEEVPPVYHTRGVRRDGGEIIIENSASVVQWDGEAAVCANMVDITDYRRTQEALQQSQKMEMVGQLTGGVAHDFNNMLTVILGNLELIATAPNVVENVKLSRWTNTSQRAAQRGADLTRRLLAFSRRQVLEPATVKPNEVIAGMTDMLSRTLGEDIELATRFDPDVSAIHVDAAQFESAILNLSVNARDAMPNGGDLIIEAADRELDAAYCGARADVEPGHYVMVEVTDSGTGMSRETLERAFEPFYTTKEVGKGTGLGLSMVYGFVKQSGGHAAIYSESGHGTTVRLYFPAGAGRSSIEPDADEGEDRAAGDRVVLVVEDDEQVRETAVGMLEVLGYQVLTAEDGPLALQVLESHPEVDLLFTDVVMPGGMTGPEVARDALRRRPDLKVLYTSGYAETALRRGGTAPDAVWLAKPYTVRRLASKLRDALSAGEEAECPTRLASVRRP